VATHWLAHRVIPLKEHIHLGWEYNRVQDPTQETSEKITPEHLLKFLEEMFQDTSSWPTDEQVSSYHIGGGKRLGKAPWLILLVLFS
jgi:hypothetical protein